MALARRKLVIQLYLVYLQDFAAWTELSTALEAPTDNLAISIAISWSTTMPGGRGSRPFKLVRDWARTDLQRPPPHSRHLFRSFPGRRHKLPWPHLGRRRLRCMEASQHRGDLRSCHQQLASGPADELGPSRLRPRQQKRTPLRGRWL